MVNMIYKNEKLPEEKKLMQILFEQISEIQHEFSFSEDFALTGIRMNPLFVTQLKEESFVFSGVGRDYSNLPNNKVGEFCGIPIIEDDRVSAIEYVISPYVRKYGFRLPKGD